MQLLRSGGHHQAIATVKKKIYNSMQYSRGVKIGGSVHWMNNLLLIGNGMVFLFFTLCLDPGLLLLTMTHDTRVPITLNLFLLCRDPKARSRLASL